MFRLLKETFITTETFVLRHLPALAAFGLALVPAGVQARSSQWWYVAQGADRVLYVDAKSIEREGDSVSYWANQILREEGNPAASVLAYMRTDCAKREETWLMVTRYGAQDERLDPSSQSYDEPEAIVSGSLGEAELDFVCAADRSQAGGFPLKIDDVAFAEALIADTQASEDPAVLHERMRNDPKVPVIRSSAPGIDTFGTEQSIAAGQAVVPPRDYAKGTQIPEADDYDPDEVGTIYDVAYIGIQDGELTFEQRGYSIFDLAHAGSAQTTRIPAAQKSVQIRDIVIDVLEATPDRLRFRAKLSGPEDEDLPFPCRETGCVQ